MQNTKRARQAWFQGMQKQGLEDPLLPALLVQAHLIGWGTGTMSSVASLSVISCAGLYGVPTRKLVFGQNLVIAFIYAIGGGLFLSLLNLLFW